MAKKTNDKKVRKELHLEKKVINLLQSQAEAEGRKLKNYMEQVLVGKIKENGINLI